MRALVSEFEVEECLSSEIGLHRFNNSISNGKIKSNQNIINSENDNEWSLAFL